MYTELIQIVGSLLERAQTQSLAVMVTSTHPNEGKSLLTRHMAWTAQMHFGERTLFSCHTPSQYPASHQSLEQFAALPSSQDLTEVEIVSNGKGNHIHSLGSEGHPHSFISTRTSSLSLSQEALPSAPLVVNEPQFDGNTSSDSLTLPTMNPNMHEMSLTDLQENPYMFLSRELTFLRQTYSLILVEVSAFQDQKGSMIPSLFAPLFDHTVVVFQPHTTSIEAIKKTLNGLPETHDRSLLLNHGGAGDSLGTGFGLGQTHNKAWTERILLKLWSVARGKWFQAKEQPKEPTQESDTHKASSGNEREAHS